MSLREAAAARIFEHHAAICTRTGIDPQVELAEARLGAGTDAGLWAAYRVVAYAAGLDTPRSRAVPAREILDHAFNLIVGSDHADAAFATVTFAADLSARYDALRGLASQSRNPDLLHELAESAGTTILADVATNPATATRTLDLLAACATPLVRRRVAGHRHASRETLIVLAADRDPLVADAARQQLQARS